MTPEDRRKYNIRGALDQYAFHMRMATMLREADFSVLTQHLSAENINVTVRIGGNAKYAAWDVAQALKKYVPLAIGDVASNYEQLASKEREAARADALECLAQIDAASQDGMR